MGSGFSKMKKQARVLEQQYSKMREEMKLKEFKGSSGNGLVTVILNGEKALKQITIKPECVNPEDIEGLQDLILAAMQEAFNLAEQESEKENPNQLGGMPFSF